MDSETKEILSEQNLLKDLVNHSGWKVAREILVEKIVELQDSFQIEDSEPEKMIRDLQARKKASTILYEWLRTLEGTATEAVDNKPMNKTHIVTFN